MMMKMTIKLFITMCALFHDVHSYHTGWTEWETTSVLGDNECGYVNNRVASTHIEKNDTIWYYYNHYGLSICSEPLPGGVPCASQMYITGELGEKFHCIPYYIWYTFHNEGTENTPTWISKLWFNFNNTQTYLLDSHLCNGKIYTITPSRCVFGEKLYMYDFDKDYSISYDMKCKYHKNKIDYELIQNTEVSNGNKNSFTMASFDNWQPFNGLVKYQTSQDTDVYYYSSDDSDQCIDFNSDQVCKYC